MTSVISRQTNSREYGEGTNEKQIQQLRADNEKL